MKKSVRHLCWGLGAWMLGIVFVHAREKPLPTPEAIPPGIEVITIRTSSPDNPEVRFYVRPPAGFPLETSSTKHRLLLIFPFVPETGLAAIARNDVLVKMADARGWFLASPTFAVDFEKHSRDRTRAFYYPERWSGRAILEAVAAIERKFPVDSGRLFIQGLSGGAQIAHRFALWQPNRVAAVAVNSSGWFDDPGPRASQTAWVITVGESDKILPESVAFVQKLKKQGAQPLFKTFLGMIHEDSPAANALCTHFLAHVDDLTKADLGAPQVVGRISPYNERDHHTFVGDFRDFYYFPKLSTSEKEIPEEVRFFLPNTEIAEIWGDPGN